MPLGHVYVSSTVTSIFSRTGNHAYGEFDVAKFHKASQGWGSTFWAALPFCGEYKVYEEACRGLQSAIENPQTKLTAIRDEIKRIIESVDEPTKTADDGTLVGDLKPMAYWRNTIIKEIASHGVDAVISDFMSAEFKAAIEAAGQAADGDAVEMVAVSAPATAPAPATTPGHHGPG